MSYLVIARKYRPLTFEDVIGQKHVTTTLINAIKNNKVHHAYILTGPRGVGKTTISRIIAKSLNCETGTTPKPCGVCSNCKEIDQGISLDVREIDGASNRGIDEIRDLRDDIKFSPAKTRKKIYIIDEVHMLTNQAFNALLKTLEEPPEHAVFIFATTEINEVPATILSRCQRHDFKRVEIDLLSTSLKAICKKEGVSIDEESLIMISKAGDGSVRDSQSALDQVIAYAGNRITADLTYEALGLPALDLYFDLLDIIISKNTGNLLDFIDSIFGKGLHIMSFIKGLVEFLRDLLILKTVKEPKILDMTGDNIVRLKKHAEYFGEKDILLFIDLLSLAVPKLKASPFQRIDFEIVLMKILHHDPVSNISEIINKLLAIEGEFEVNIEDITRDLLRSAGQINFSKPDTEKHPDITDPPETEKKKPLKDEAPDNADSEDLVLKLDDVTARWKEFVYSKAVVELLNPNSLEYSVPFRFDNNTLHLKFDPAHVIFYNFCVKQQKIICKALRDFYGSDKIDIEIVKNGVSKDERIITIPKTPSKKTEEEKKMDLLKRSPNLKFLFEEPFNCKFID